MGVDASYLYGYGIEISAIEWDLDYLREKYKDKLDEKTNPKYTYRPTWKEFIEDIEEALEDEDYSLITECLEDINHLLEVDYDDEEYITFNHKHIANLYPEAKLKDLDNVAKLYAKELGIKNVEDVKWIEWGYFS